MSITLKTSPVTFCHTSVDQLIDHHSKSTIVNAIEQLISEKVDVRPTHRIVRTEKDATFLRNPHVIQLATKGTRYWMFLTQLQHHNICMMVERFIKPGYPFPKMLMVPYQFEEVLYQNTLFEVDVIENAGSTDTPLLLVNDLVVLKNRNVQEWDPIRRHNVLHTIFEKQFYDNMSLQPCAIQIKTLYAPSDWNAMRKTILALPYTTKGFIFLPINTRFPVRMWIDDDQELTKENMSALGNTDAIETKDMSPTSQAPMVATDKYSKSSFRGGRGHGHGKGGGHGPGKGGGGRGKGGGKTANWSGGMGGGWVSNIHIGHSNGVMGGGVPVMNTPLPHGNRPVQFPPSCYYGQPSSPQQHLYQYPPSMNPNITEIPSNCGNMCMNMNTNTTTSSPSVNHYAMNGLQHFTPNLPSYPSPMSHMNDTIP